METLLPFRIIFELGNSVMARVLFSALRCALPAAQRDMCADENGDRTRGLMPRGRSADRGKVRVLPSAKAPPNGADEARPDDHVDRPEPASQGNEGIVVAGMHRTGTSAVTRILMNLRCCLPSDPIPPSKDNPKGNWVPRGIVETHEEFLHAIGRTWSDPRPLPEQCFLGGPADEARKRLAQLVPVPL